MGCLLPLAHACGEGSTGTPIGGQAVAPQPSDFRCQRKLSSAGMQLKQCCPNHNCRPLPVSSAQSTASCKEAKCFGRFCSSGA